MPVGYSASAGGGTSGPATSGINSGFNSSGWNVNFGPGSIDSGNSKLLIYALIAAGVYLAWKSARRGR